jgi:ketosteroid isomerase-like protein
MKLAPLFSILALVSLPCLAEDSPKAQVQDVVERFQAAIKAHDGKALGTMFLPDSKAWITALGQASFEKVRQKHPEVPPYKSGTWQEFAKYVSEAKDPIEERFHDVRIETDGTVASVYFDFEFVAAGKVANRGAETWQMLRTPDGWKIVAMLYSSNF